MSPQHPKIQPRTRQQSVVPRTAQHARVQVASYTVRDASNRTVPLNGSTLLQSLIPQFQYPQHQLNFAPSSTRARFPYIAPMNAKWLTSRRHTPVTRTISILIDHPRLYPLPHIILLPVHLPPVNQRAILAALPSIHRPLVCPLVLPFLPRYTISPLSLDHRPCLRTTFPSPRFQRIMTAVS